jgi:hypothetical protein
LFHDPHSFTDSTGQRKIYFTFLFYLFHTFPLDGACKCSILPAMKKTPPTFQAVDKERLAKLLTIGDVRGRAGVSASDYTAWARKRKHPNPDQLARIASAVKALPARTRDPRGRKPLAGKGVGK